MKVYVPVEYVWAEEISWPLGVFASREAAEKRLLEEELYRGPGEVMEWEVQE